MIIVLMSFREVLHPHLNLVDHVKLTCDARIAVDC